MKLPAGSTSKSVYFDILSGSNGNRKTGLAYNSSGITAYYVRSGGAATSITLANLAAADSAWSSGGFKEVHATNMPGVYRLDLPDAALASGADSVVVTLKGSGFVQVSKEIELENPEALLDRANGVESGWTLRQAMRVMLSVLAGKASGADVMAPVFRDPGDTKDRVSATTDANGNRTAVTYDVS